MRKLLFNFIMDIYAFSDAHHPNVCIIHSKTKMEVPIL